jgi:predicted nucleic acid-binding Zn ribbon protein
MERSRVQTLKEVIEQYLKETPLHRKFQERHLMECWYELLGKTVTKNTKKLYIRKDILYVQLTSSVLRNELFMMKGDIISKLNERVGEQIITGIVFT